MSSPGPLLTLRLSRTFARQRSKGIFPSPGPYVPFSRTISSSGGMTGSGSCSLAGSGSSKLSTVSGISSTKVSCAGAGVSTAGVVSGVTVDPAGAAFSVAASVLFDAGDGETVSSSEIISSTAVFSGMLSSLSLTEAIEVVWEISVSSSRPHATKIAASIIKDMI